MEQSKVIDTMEMYQPVRPNEGAGDYGDHGEHGTKAGRTRDHGAGMDRVAHAGVQGRARSGGWHGGARACGEGMTGGAVNAGERGGKREAHNIAEKGVGVA